MCARTMSGARDGSGRRAFEAVSSAVRVVSWDCRVRICVWRRACKGLGGEVDGWVEDWVVVVAVAVGGEVDGWVVGGWVMMVFEKGGVLKGSVCAAVEGRCSSGFVIADVGTELVAAWTAGTSNDEEAGGDVDVDVDFIINSPSDGSSRRSSKSEEWPSSSWSSCELEISPSGRIGRLGVREGGGMDILRLGMLNWRLGYK